jgi:type IV pilus assembly protein PilX
MMSLRSATRPTYGRAKQDGVVLFFALVALVVMSLAAVALIRSVDTSTMIAGNLAFRQSAVASADSGSEAAINWLAAQQTAMNTAGLNVHMDANHVFNQDNVAQGYYTKFRPITDLTDGTFNWNNSSKLVGTDANTGNTVRYVIERMCDNANSIPLRETCLLTPIDSNANAAAILYYDGICRYDPGSSPGCPILSGQTPQLRLTARVTGPKNTVSYIQTFVY